MDAYLKLLRETPLPSILVIGGIVFLLLSVLQKAGTSVETKPGKEKFSIFVGIVLLLSGISLYLVPPSQSTASVATPTNSSPSTVNAPTEPPTPTTSNIWRDDFDSPVLDSQWKWKRENVNFWSLSAKPGFLQITTQPGSLFWNGTVNNLLYRSAPQNDFDVETFMYFLPTSNYQIAGVLIYLDDDNYLWLSRAYCITSRTPDCVGNFISFDYEENGNPNPDRSFSVITQSKDSAHLKIERRGQTFTAYYSENGLDWITIGQRTIGFNPYFVGLAAANGNLETPGEFNTKEAFAGFDFLQLSSK